jgi:hypothetical protein
MLVHFPAVHTCPEPQAVPQPPQLRGSVDVSTQAPLHKDCPVAHEVVHAPFEHTWPTWHGFEQAPQLSGFDLKSTHAPLQDVVPVGHWQVKADPPAPPSMPLGRQMEPPLQALLQAPQFASVLSAVH